MGKFSGYLICTDLDGTFASKGEPVAENLEAVRYFVKNGGRFTVATGRMVEFIREKGLVSLINAPAILCNGSVIYDYSQEKILRERRMGFSVREFLNCIKPVAHLVRLLYVYPDVATGCACYDDLTRISHEHMDTNALKLLCKFETVEAADAFQAYSREHPFLCNSYISKSWHFGVEFNAMDATKGHAVDFLKSYLGKIHTSVGVGNFDNDLPLLQHADLKAAPANANECILEVADLVLVPCADGAIKDLIERLEHRM